MIAAGVLVACAVAVQTGPVSTQRLAAPEKAGPLDWSKLK